MSSPPVVAAVQLLADPAVSGDRMYTLNQPAEIEDETLLELAKRVIRIAGSRSEIVFRPLPEDDPKVRQPDITRARRLLGWEPRVDTDEGLRRTLEWFRAQVAG